MSDKLSSEKLSGPMVPSSSGTTKQIVVLLHGYGSDGQDLISLAPYWSQLLPDAMFVAPNAPSKCDINPAGYQWFPLDLDRGISRLTGSEMVRPVVQEFLNSLWEETGLTAAETILVGFSQGAMMVLDVGLRLETPVKGIVAFSGGLISPETIGDAIKSKPPVMFIHGEADDVVPVAMSVLGHQALQGLGVQSHIHISPGSGHTIAQDGMQAATGFIGELAGLAEK